MGASRKLQGEIDRVLKKVQEGVDVFDSIWNKVYDTENANQKEKFESDLKKEIKKLQRYRDQIKTWIQSSEIKDKKVSASYEQALVDARKLIEREMERFKICEKETKTKAFSKEGLGQQPKTDPKEKAKSETRDWLNNVVGELESQIDNFEAELEGLSVKKGKTRPPRLVNDVKDFLDDYVERNQEDFDEFSDVDELYSSLPLDKVEALEDLVTIGPPGLVKGAPSLGLKTSLAASATQMPVAATSIHQQSSSVQEPVEDTASPDSIPETVPITPPSKSSVLGSSTATTPVASNATSAPVNIPSHNFPAVPTASSILSGSNSVRVTESTRATNSLSPGNLSPSVKEEELGSFPSRRSSPSFTDAGLVRGIGRGGISSQLSSSAPLSSNNVVPGSSALGVVPSTSDIAKRNILGVEERVGSSGLVQSLPSPLSNRLILPQAAKSNNGTGSLDSGNVSEATALAGRVLSPTMVSGMPWRPGSEAFRGRTEVEPDQREKFLQRLQQVQHNNLLGHKQFSAQQQNPLLQQFNSQNASVSQAGLGLGVQTSGLGTVSSSTLQQQTSSVHQLSTHPALVSNGAKESEIGHAKVDEQQQQNLPDDSAADHTTTSGLGKNPMSEDDLKAPYAIDSPAGVSGSLTELAQVPRDTDLSPGQPLQANQSSGSLGVIGRRSVSDLGAIGDNVTVSTVNSGGMHDQLHNLQMLDAAYYKLPQPKDSERTRNYTPRHPAMTPPSYPQVQAPIVNNPAFWERLGLENYSTDTLFFSFYHQQNTYPQYLAAKELKKQSWRYHRKYNTWFQRHEEPKVATDEYEQGTYVYFDFHVANDDLGVGQNQGWCQRIKNEFTFEYNYLEDELIV
ncbi:CCR4-NOT transcription complex subunit 3 isoform X4 [Morus notabilis]|uniref:CCR4-NOT transcription complex subunit 3 isoform X4 n=1 Tax=Morus notabilis TaxID=981085 RepID=UPI000CED195C|nr:CCR4-NOT transcription complex subunit 3 isoform X4 [Morus notabilis]